MKIFGLSILFFLTGCTYAGPFVTHITQNKDGTITQEKCMVEHNAFSGAISTVNCTTTKT